MFCFDELSMRGRIGEDEDCDKRNAEMRERERERLVTSGDCRRLDAKTTGPTKSLHKTKSHGLSKP